MSFFFDSAGKDFKNGGRYMFDIHVYHTFFLVGIISGLPLLFSSVVGLLVAVFQTATQIQEQSITFLAKLLSAVLVIIFGATWFSTQLVQLFQGLISSIAALGNL